MGLDGGVCVHPTFDIQHYRRMDTISRRECLLGLAAAGCALPLRIAGAAAQDQQRRLILVIFGAGVRNSETIDDREARWIPRLRKSLIPRGTLWTNVRVERLVVHPNCNATIKTGHHEYEDLDWERPPRHPTIFEMVRKARTLSDTAAWSFVYASILAQTGASAAEGFGPQYAANVVEPPTIPRAAALRMDRLMAEAAASGSSEAEGKAAAECAVLARSAAQVSHVGLRSAEAKRWLAERFATWQKAEGTTTSHDAFLAEGAIDCMKRFSPHVLSVDFGETDAAHYGSWSRYTAAIQRNDELTWRLCQTIEELPDYRGQTLLLVLPDHGRELERPGGSGFIHHSDFYMGEGADEGCRRVWMLAIGPDIAVGRTIDRPTPQAAAAATGLEFLGLAPSPGAATSVLAAAR